jgi:membrane-bound lytic murein transglycosylase F
MVPAIRNSAGLLLLLLLALGAGSCGGSGEGDAEGGGGAFANTVDLDRIVERGELRILLPRRGFVSRLPRSGYPLDFERELMEGFAQYIGVEAVWVTLDSRDRMIPALLGGKGDIAAANLTATRERKKMVDFTVPVAVVREQVVARVDDDSVAAAEDLVGRSVAVRRSSSFWGTVSRLRQQHPGIEIEEVEEDVDTEEIIHRVAMNEYDLTVADSNLVEACLEYRDDIRAAFDLTRDRPVAMAVRPGSSELLARLDRFLTDAQLTARSDTVHLEDLPEIKQRRVLRQLTRNSAATYFLWRGQLMGFEYDLMKEFARQQRLRLEVIVPPSGEDLLPWLREGRGDVVAAALTPTEERMEGGVAFTRPYNYVEQVIVARADEHGLNGPEDLAGRTVWVRPSSAYRQTLEHLQANGIDVEIGDAPEDMETEEIIAQVALGDYDLTLADSHIVDIEVNWRDDVKATFALTNLLPLSWAVRESNPELYAALNEFLQQEYRGLYYNIIYERYFRDARKIRTHRQDRADLVGDLSPYDATVKKYAEHYGFDWRLVVAMMYEESRFNPRARSFAGATGLMQVLPRTADEFGFEDLHDPEEAIHAGVKYLDWVRDRFEADLGVQDRMWFTLAAYNAGAGHVRDARRLASQLGLNPNKWFGNVERAMLLLSRPQYAQAAQHGYCRCGEPVRYVRNVRSRYNAYVETIGA